MNLHTHVSFHFTNISAFGVTVPFRVENSVSDSFYDLAYVESLIFTFLFFGFVFTIDELYQAEDKLHMNLGRFWGYGGFKALLGMLTADPGAGRRSASHAALPGERFHTPGLFAEERSNSGLNPAIRLIDVLSALPPAQVPAWFKQRFAGEPMFGLQEFRQLTPAQRLQMLVLVENTLNSRLFRPSEEAGAAMNSFLSEARRI